MSIATNLNAIYRGAFRNLPGWKKRLMQLSIGLLGVGAVAQGHAQFSSGSESGVDSESLGWSLTALRSGAGCLFGFLIGAALRLFLKLGLLLAFGAAAVTYGLSLTGLYDLPWDSFGEVYQAFGAVLERESSNLQAFVSGYLPSSGMTGLGLVSGVTNKPDFELDEFDFKPGDDD